MLLLRIEQGKKVTIDLCKKTKDIVKTNITQVYGYNPIPYDLYCELQYKYGLAKRPKQNKLFSPINTPKNGKN